MKTLMDLHGPFGQRSGGSIAGLLTFALISLTGCQSARPDPAAEDAVTQATALGEPLTFRVEGGPLDEPAAGDTLSFLDATRRAVLTDSGLQGALARVRIAMARDRRSGCASASTCMGLRRSGRCRSPPGTAASW